MRRAAKSATLREAQPQIGHANDHRAARIMGQIAKPPSRVKAARIVVAAPTPKAQRSARRDVRATPRTPPNFAGMVTTPRSSTSASAASTALRRMNSLKVMRDCDAASSSSARSSGETLTLRMEVAADCSFMRVTIAFDSKLQFEGSGTTPPRRCRNKNHRRFESEYSLGTTGWRHSSLWSICSVGSTSSNNAASRQPFNTTAPHSARPVPARPEPHRHFHRENRAPAPRT